MAIFNPSAVIGAISGKLGGCIFVNGPSGRVVRHRPATAGGSSPNHETAAQQLVLVQRLWATLTDEQRASWASFGRDNPTTNRLGRTRPLTAYLAFTRYNLVALSYDEPTQLTPVSIHDARYPDSMTLTATTAALTLDYLPTGFPTFLDCLLYAATLPQSHTPKSFHNWRFIDHLLLPPGGSESFTSRFEAKWPPVVLGQAIGVRADFHSNYYRPVKSFTFNQLVTAP